MMAEAMDEQAEDVEGFKDGWHAPELTVLGGAGDVTKNHEGTTSDGSEFSGTTLPFS